jgi:histidine triad (HIT) family protein
MRDCIFCRIIKKEIPSTMVYEDDRVVAFKDINPAAPVHILIVPRQHIAGINELDSENISIVGDIHLAAKKIAKQQGIAKSGYRLISNCGKNAGQTVLHLHYHLLGGVDMGPDIII